MMHLPLYKTSGALRKSMSMAVSFLLLPEDFRPTPPSRLHMRPPRASSIDAISLMDPD
jgi:hypothetical protein